MIIETQDDVTRAVLGEMHRTPDARTRELLTLLVKHLHAFVREARLTERRVECDTTPAAGLVPCRPLVPKTSAGHTASA